jgi:hypothetical protein
MRCGDHITIESNPTDGYCYKCESKTIFAVVTEENKDSLPFPTNPIGMKNIDFNDPGKNCQCRAGTCPCGKFVAHAISDPCNANDFNTKEAKEKELIEQLKAKK